MNIISNWTLDKLSLDHRLNLDECYDEDFCRVIYNNELYANFSRPLVLCSTYLIFGPKSFIREYQDTKSLDRISSQEDKEWFFENKYINPHEDNLISYSRKNNIYV